jgi:hypothetical protein
VLLFTFADFCAAESFTPPRRLIATWLRRATGNLDIQTLLRKPVTLSGLARLSSLLSLRAGAGSLNISS